jgi:crotonobetainyl-CoA:carnitine CoA-transferase CaiB-like acyl-CoA transferase
MLRNILKGLAVLDFTHVAAGPTCSMLLADLGARTIKVEPPGGELGRTLGPAWIGDDSALYHAFNRNKQGICIDLKTEKGVQIAKRIATQSDVLIESMRPGTMKRLGLGYEELAEFNPRLIYCSISAYGQKGPYASNPGVDGIIQADSGLMSLIGWPGVDPGKVQSPIVDVFTGYLGAMAVLAKLIERQNTGRGGWLDVSLMNASLALQLPPISSYLADGELPKPIGSAAPYSAPNEALRTSDGWIMIAAYNRNRWETLCEVLNEPELSLDEKFSTSQKRVQNREAMREKLNAAFSKNTTKHWVEVLREADIICAPVANYDDVLEHPQMATNCMINSISHRKFGVIRSLGFPINSAEENSLPHSAAPDLGEHSREILAVFGYNESQIEQLIEEKIIYSG